ncbi:hypothetical protein L211DRAFT_853947 [Terfezia boudieri ATCC MYA-4762]|uniref:Uncharacterized protein n=1 Tax=Terfezia boudieri ATCC MYA-4762 TaxID=1051890 RepID=A0A3N4LAU8_9PEZI|nr:hypothetical protein L211DRAFT_853947 [Terfezia boudieri ATCC MYA-4762]
MFTIKASDCIFIDSQIAGKLSAPSISTAENYEHLPAEYLPAENYEHLLAEHLPAENYEHLPAEHIPTKHSSQLSSDLTTKFAEPKPTEPAEPSESTESSEPVDSAKSTSLSHTLLVTTLAVNETEPQTFKQAT